VSFDGSLVNGWQNKFEQIMNNLQRDIPIYAKSDYHSMPIFAWKNDGERPLPFASDGCISGGGEGSHSCRMSFEIPTSEFEHDQLRR